MGYADEKNKLLGLIENKLETNKIMKSEKRDFRVRPWILPF